MDPAHTVARANGSVARYDGRRLVRIDGDGWQHHFEGPPGEERLVRATGRKQRGFSWYYDGARGEERLAYKKCLGDVLTYVGPSGHERLARREFPGGTRLYQYDPCGRLAGMQECSATWGRAAVQYVYGADEFFPSRMRVVTLRDERDPEDGAAVQVQRRCNLACSRDADLFTVSPEVGRAEAMWSIERADGTARLFRGERGEEALHLVVAPDGTCSFYEGGRASERKVRVVLPDGVVCEYENDELRAVRRADGVVEEYARCGDADAKRAARWPDGRVEFFERVGDEDCLVCAECAVGGEEHFVGPAGHEALARVVHVDGSEDVYEGARGDERKVRTLRSDGSVCEYEGAPGDERLTLVTVPEFEVTLDDGTRVRVGKCAWHDCCVCLAAGADTAFVPCGHVCLCRDCAGGKTTVDRCPLCRASGAPLRLFF